jgi:hypothetical protein
VTSCHYSTLTSSAHDSECRQSAWNLGQTNFTKICTGFLLHFYKQRLSEDVS